MKIIIDENNNIVSYATVGDFENSIEIDYDIIPPNFIQEFKPTKFKYENEAIVYNRGYEEEISNTIVQQVENENQQLRDEINNLNSKVDELSTMIAQLIESNNTPT